MAFLFNPEFWARWLGIVFIDLSLAGDNALVIAMAVRTLPPREQFFGRIGGAFGAVALRIAFIAVITQLLRISFLQAIGGLLLIWIAIKLVRQDGGDAEGKGRLGTTLWQAIWLIIGADLIMSLDNILAVAAAARGDLILVVFGISLSIPIVIWGSGLLARLMNRFQWIVWLGGGVLGWVAGEMMIKDAIVRSWTESRIGALDWGAPGALAVGLTLLGWLLARRSPYPPEQEGSTEAAD